MFNKELKEQIKNLQDQIEELQKTKLAYVDELDEAKELIRVIKRCVPSSRSLWEISIVRGRPVISCYSLFGLNELNLEELQEEVGTRLLCYTNR